MAFDKGKTSNAPVGAMIGHSYCAQKPEKNKERNGAPKGIRTPVTAVKGRCPGPARRWGPGRKSEPCWIRTSDPHIKSVLLYQLS